MPSVAITTLTPAAVQQDLQSDGIDSLGLTTLSLATRWADATPSEEDDYDKANLTLRIPSLRAPFRGIREFAFSAATSTLASALDTTATTLVVQPEDGRRFPEPSGGGNVLLVLSNASGMKEVVSCTERVEDGFTIERAALGTANQSFKEGDRVTLRLTPAATSAQFIGADGNVLAEACLVLRLHPQAILRLQTLMAQRYTSAGSALLLPIPWSMVVRGVEGFRTPQWFEPGEQLDANGFVSFHDGRGLIIDPIYVAAVFDDLQTFLPGLVGRGQSSMAADGAGGVQKIAGLANGTLVHCIDLHGGVYMPALPEARLVTKSAGGTEQGVPTSGLVSLASNDGIDVANDNNGRLRWGFATNGVLGRSRLVPPPLASPLQREFYQVAVVDTVWALLGNRTISPVLGIEPDDQTIPSDVIQSVRDNVAITYLVDGPDVLARSAAVLARPWDIALAISPLLDAAMSVPAQAGANAHWPMYPPGTGTGFSSPLVSPATGVTAEFTSGFDVIVKVAANCAPAGAHIRIYPCAFVVIPAIAEEPSFIRGDGGAGIAREGECTQILLTNPFRLASGQPRPDPAHLTMDIVVAPRNGRRKLWSNVTINVDAGPALPPEDPFAGGNDVASLQPAFESIAPSPLFGIPTEFVPPGTAPVEPISLVRALGSETSPRQGPRLPTMARFDTVIVTGIPNPPGHALAWEAVLSGGRWAPETRSALHKSGNPGNPAGPDIHAAGIHVTGALAYDLARHAMRRAKPILPLNDDNLGWLIAMDEDKLDPPNDTDTTQTGIGALLETVAATTETPELSVLDPPASGSAIQTAVNQIASALGIPAPTAAIRNEPRVQTEIRREFKVSRNGLRDALWSLRRAVREARELIYIESPQFAHTGSTDIGAKSIDLVNDIVTSLSAHPNLRVIICTPRESDFAQNYGGWTRQHFQSRLRAIGSLLAAAPDRVVVFHPVGFPGRTSFVRTTCAIVDDVWCLVGATHWRRRGMTLDGSTAIASFDRQMESGYCKNVRAFRRLLMAAKLGISQTTGETPSSDWLRLSRPHSAFELVSDWLAAGGLGLIQPLWSGPSDTTVQAATDDVADPDGSNGATFVATFASLVAELGDQVSR